MIWLDQVRRAVVAGRPAPCPMSRALQICTSDNDHTANAVQNGPNRWNQLYGIDSESKMITYFWDPITIKLVLCDLLKTIYKMLNTPPCRSNSHQDLSACRVHSQGTTDVSIPSYARELSGHDLATSGILRSSHAGQRDDI